MIYILFGNDTKNKSSYIKELTLKSESFFISSSNLDKNLILSYSNNIDLFGESKSVILDNILNSENIGFSLEEMNFLKESKTIFIFKEDKLLALDQKKYKKYGEIIGFELKKSLPEQKFNVFSITDAFARRDKITTWILYQNAIYSGIEPEAISGILFWKIKTMILNGTTTFSKDQLKKQSSSIVSLYHRAHRGECDFHIGLEQFILSSLS